MRQTVKNRMIKNVQMMAVGMMATASIMGTAAAMGVKMDNIPFNVLANPFQAVMTQGVAADSIAESGTLITSYDPEVKSITYEIDSDGTLTIKGEGELSVVMLDSPSSTFEGRQDIKKVVVEEGITSIGGFFFKNCANIAEIEFPQTLKSINGGAFVNLDALKQISIPDGVTEIGIYVFSDCNNLTEIHGMNGVKTITQAFGVSNDDGLLETSLDTTNEYVLNYDWTTYGRKIKENKEWYYSEEDESFVADTNQIGSVVDDYYKIWSYSQLNEGRKNFEFVVSNQQNAFVSKIYIEGGQNSEEVEIPDFVKGILSSSYDAKLIKDDSLVGRRYNETEDESVLEGGSNLIGINKGLFVLRKEDAKVPGKLIIKGNVGQNLTGMFVGKDKEKETLLSVVQEIKVVGTEGVKVKSISKMFVDMKNLVKVDLSELDLSEVKGIEDVFKNCPRLKEVNLGNMPLKLYDLSKMINGCDNLKKLIIQNQPKDLGNPQIVESSDTEIRFRYVRSEWDYPFDMKIKFNKKYIEVGDLYNLDDDIEKIIHDDKDDKDWLPKNIGECYEFIKNGFF